MAPCDAGGTFRIGSRPEVAIRRGILGYVVQLSRRPAAGYLGYFGGLARTCVMDDGVSTTPVAMMVDGKNRTFQDSRVWILEDVVMGIPRAKVP